MKVHMQHKLWILVIMIMIVNLVTGCIESEVSGKSSSAGTVYKMSSYDLNQYPMNKTVCDPFAGGAAATPENGVKATLFYRGINQPRYYLTSDYVTKATKSTQTLFFKDIAVPTRMFTEGFKTQTSDYVKDDAGYRLMEYFALKFETNIQLTANMPAGEYEFASLADDGMTMKAKINGVWETIVDNDGDHPTRMGCAKKTVTMKQGQNLEVEITYYQGPRYHISNVLLWKYAGGSPGAGSSDGKGGCKDDDDDKEKNHDDHDNKLATKDDDDHDDDHDDGKNQTTNSSQVAKGDLYCGKLGNEFFFDPNRGSIPLQPFKDLLARGWQIVDSSHFFVTASTNYNPCVAGTVPVMSQVTVVPRADSAIFQWTTDIPTSSQIMISDVVTGQQTLTVTDNALRTVHEVTVTGLTANTPYRARAISVSSDLGRAMSPDINFTTFPNLL